MCRWSIKPHTLWSPSTCIKSLRLFFSSTHHVARSTSRPSTNIRLSPFPPFFWFYLQAWSKPEGLDWQRRVWLQVLYNDGGSLG
jgi:hypothetical protein